MYNLLDSLSSTLASKMDERCKTAHPRLLAGTCPWCGCFIANGKLGGHSSDKFVTSEMESGASHLRYTLEDLVRANGKLTVEVAVRIVELIAKKLAVLHQTHSMYGRLAPSNICLESGGIILRDSTAVAGHQDLQLASVDAMEIADYLAPEQALSASLVDQRADVYSLGCVLYFMLVGQPPFATGSIAERLLHHQIEAPPNLCAVREDVPIRLSNICGKMLAKKPEDRHPSTDDVLLALESWRAENR